MFIVQQKLSTCHSYYTYLLWRLKCVTQAKIEISDFGITKFRKKSYSNKSVLFDVFFE